MLQVELKNHHYYPFIKYALSTCDCFSLVFPKCDMQKTEYISYEVYEKVQSFALKKKSIGIHPDTGTHFDYADIVYFPCNKLAGSILFSLGNLINCDGYFSPTELCFYRNSQKWFVSINHEKQAIIANATSDDLIFLTDAHIGHCSIVS